MTLACAGEARTAGSRTHLWITAGVSIKAKRRLDCSKVRIMYTMMDGSRGAQDDVSVCRRGRCPLRGGRNDRPDAGLD